MDASAVLSDEEKRRIASRAGRSCARALRTRAARRATASLRWSGCAHGSTPLSRCSGRAVPRGPRPRRGAGAWNRRSGAARRSASGAAAVETGARGRLRASALGRGRRHGPAAGAAGGRLGLRGGRGRRDGSRGAAGRVAAGRGRDRGDRRGRRDRRARLGVGGLGLRCSCCRRGCPGWSGGPARPGWSWAPRCRRRRARRSRAARSGARRATAAADRHQAPAAVDLVGLVAGRRPATRVQPACGRIAQNGEGIRRNAGRLARSRPRAAHRWGTTGASRRASRTPRGAASRHPRDGGRPSRRAAAARRPARGRRRVSSYT